MSNIIFLVRPSDTFARIAHVTALTDIGRHTVHLTENPELAEALIKDNAGLVPQMLIICRFPWRSTDLGKLIQRAKQIDPNLKVLLTTDNYAKTETLTGVDMTLLELPQPVRPSELCRAVRTLLQE